MLNSDAINFIDKVFNAMIGKINVNEVLKGSDGVNKLQRKRIPGMENFTPDITEIVLRYSPSFSDGLDHIILHQLQPFMR